MGLGLSPNLVNNLVNTVYKINGKDPYSDNKRDAIKTTEGVKRTFGDSMVFSDGLKRALNNPNNPVAISLKDPYHPETADQVADLVSSGLDRADGAGNGWVNLEGRGQFADALRDYTGIKREGYISTDALRWGLENGNIVIGEGGQLLDRADAKAHGDTIVALHEDKDGPKFALDR